MLLQPCFYQICHREGFTRSCCLVNRISQQVNTTCAADGPGMVVSTLCPCVSRRKRPIHFSLLHPVTLTLSHSCHLLGYFIDRNDIFGTNYNASCIQIAIYIHISSHFPHQKSSQTPYGAKSPLPYLSEVEK